MDQIEDLLGEAIHTGTLDLSSRLLQEVPCGITACAALVVLDLSANSITQLPPSITALLALQVLDVSFNKLEAVPPEVASLACLTSLNLSYNQLSSICTEVVQLHNLEVLSLNDNQLTALPSQIDQLVLLRELRLQYNQLSRLPVQLASLPSLEMLELDGNPLPPAVVSAAAAVGPASTGSTSSGAQRGVVHKGLFNAIARTCCQLDTAMTEPGGTDMGHAGLAARSDSTTVLCTAADAGRGEVDILVLDGEGGSGAIESHHNKQNSYSNLAHHPWPDNLQASSSSQLVGAGRPGSASSTGCSSHSIGHASSSADMCSTAQQALQVDMEELSQLPPASAAVLYRTMDAIQTGVGEIQAGRPLSRGGADGVSTPGRLDLPRASSSSYNRLSTSSCTRRPGTSSTTSRPATSLRLSRDYASKSQLPPRPGTSSARHPSGMQVHEPNPPVWLPLSGVEALLANNRPASPATLCSRPSTSLSSPRAPQAQSGQPYSPNRPTTAHRHGMETTSGQSKVAGAGGQGGGLDAMPVITFPLTSGVRSMLRQMSSGLPEGCAGKLPSSHSGSRSRPSSGSAPDSESHLPIGELQSLALDGGQTHQREEDPNTVYSDVTMNVSASQHAYGHSSWRSASAPAKGASPHNDRSLCTAGSESGNDDSEDELSVVRQLLHGRDPSLLDKLESILDAEDGDTAERYAAGLAGWS